MVKACIDCPDVADVKGSDKKECTKYHWEFGVTLAKSQALCDNRANADSLENKLEA